MLAVAISGSIDLIFGVAPAKQAAKLQPYVRAQYLMLVGKIGTPQQQQEAIAQTASWLQSHPSDRYVRQHYLELNGKGEVSCFRAEKG